MFDDHDPSVEEAERIITAIWDDPRCIDHCRDAIDAAAEGRISKRALILYCVLRKAYEMRDPAENRREATRAATGYALHWLARIRCLVKDPPEAREGMSALQIATILTPLATAAIQEARRELERVLEDELAPHGLMPLPPLEDEEGEWWKDGSGEIPYTGD